MKKFQAGINKAMHGSTSERKAASYTAYLRFIQMCKQSESSQLIANWNNKQQMHSSNMCHDEPCYISWLPSLDRQYLSDLHGAVLVMFQHFVPYSIHPAAAGSGWMETKCCQQFKDSDMSFANSSAGNWKY